MLSWRYLNNRVHYIIWIKMDLFGKNKEKGKDRRFTWLDVWFHFGMGINLVIILLLIWYAMS